MVLAAVFVFAVPSMESASTGHTVSTVSAKTYNQELRTRRSLTGKPIRLAKKPVRVEVYTKLRSNNLRTKHLCIEHRRKVRATWYTDSVGYKGDYLANHPQNFAELSKNAGAKDFSALGGLPYKTKLWFHHSRYDVPARKLDIGAGGPRHPKVDLWRGPGGLANRLHFNDGFVFITKSPCRGAW